MTNSKIFLLTALGLLSANAFAEDAHSGVEKPREELAKRWILEVEDGRKVSIIGCDTGGHAPLSDVGGKNLEIDRDNFLADKKMSKCMEVAITSLKSRFDTSPAVQRAMSRFQANEARGLNLRPEARLESVGQCGDLDLRNEIKNKKTLPNGFQLYFRLGAVTPTTNLFEVRQGALEGKDPATACSISEQQILDWIELNRLNVVVTNKHL